MKTDTLLLTTQYLPCIEYLSTFALGCTVYIEAHENYQKGSYRNRTHLLGSNGTEILSLPLVKGKHQQTPINKVLIHNSTWKKQHLGMIKSAYGNSPFFEYFYEELESLFLNSSPQLIEFNRALLLFLLKSFGLNTPILLTESYQPSVQGILDLRNQFSPKKQIFSTPPVYDQVFSYKFGFTPGLSSLDLLFCQGPYGISILKETANNYFRIQ